MKTPATPLPILPVSAKNGKLYDMQGAYLADCHEQAYAAYIAHAANAYPQLVAALRTLAQQPKGGEVIGYGPERQAAFDLGWNAGLNAVHAAARDLLASLGEES